MEPVAFFSYAHLDDASIAKEISQLHASIQSELQIQIGMRVQIFFDQYSIGWGDRWKEFIAKNLNGVLFLVPILTPAFFRSEHCKEEYLQFLELEKRSGRRDLIRPIYYVDSREMASKGGLSSMVDDILSRQYKDWRELRHEERDAPIRKKRLAELGYEMAKTYFNIEEFFKLGKAFNDLRISEDQVSIDYFEKILDSDIDYQNIVAYAVELEPSLPVSPEWIRRILRDIDKNRYNTIRDIDREVKYAKTKVDEYAIKRPCLFKYSTDYITKSLIFVDSDFRRVHSMRQETLEAAKEANITRY